MERLDQTSFDCEGTNACKNIAAILSVGDDRLVNEDLQEEIVDIDIGPRGLGNDGDLGGQRIGAPYPSI